MPPTLVHAAVAVLVGVALLGTAFDRRSLALVAVAGALPDLDAVLSLAIEGATNAVLHSVFLPLGAALVLYWDAERREASRLRERYGARGVRVAWVAIAAYAVAGIGLDLFNVESAAVLYPLSDRFYAVVGQFVVSTQEGVIQTYVEFGDGPALTSRGTMATYHVPSWVNPVRGPDPPGVERRVRLVESGWQLVVVLTALAAATARWLLEGRHDPPIRGGEW